MNKKDKAFFKDVINVSSCDPVYDSKGNIANWKVIVECSDVNSFRAPNVRGGWLVLWVQTLDENQKALHRLTYVFKDGLFGRGAEHAWQFRINMLGQMAKRHNENTK